MVGTDLTGAQWQAPADQTVGLDDRDRCIPDGMGSQLSRRQHKGPLDRSQHINYLELMAAFLALKAYLRNQGPLSILLRLDNITVIVYLNRMGGTHSLTLSRLAVEMGSYSKSGRNGAFREDS